MQYLASLAPIAFVFALAAITKVNGLEKELEELKKELKIDSKKDE